MRMLLQRGLLPVAGASQRTAAVAPRAVLRVVACGATHQHASTATARRAAPFYASAIAAVISTEAGLHKQNGARFVRCCSTACGAAPGSNGDAAAAGQQQQQQGEPEYLVINFYHLVDIPDTAEMMERQRAFLADKDVRGRIYISPHGINCQAGGRAGDARAYVEWIEQQPEFRGVYYSLWPAPGHVHPKLRLKEKPSLISLAGGVDGLRVTDPAARATPLGPAQWREMLRRADEVNRKVEAGQEEERVVVLDVRNDYEWDAGHFQWAGRPQEEEFSETPVGDDDGAVPDYLRGLPKDTPVMMYCTGGIRCDIYSTFLRQRGYQNLYTLEGGIQNYLRETPGGEGWNGSLFVFDGRLAINPAIPGGDTGAAELPAAVPCQLCSSAPAKLPHMNCANIDCNELFIACASCRERYQGCCCDRCMAAPRLLRPIKIDGGNYAQWTSYADEESVGPVMATGRSSEGRLARRRRRREALRAKRADYLEKRREEKKRVKELMRQVEAARQQQLEQQGDQEPGRQQEAAGTARR